MPLDRKSIEELLRDPMMLKITTVVNLASLSILELLEYGFSREDINAAMARGVIAINKSKLPANVASSEKISFDYGDYYFKFLSSLTELGIYILETIDDSERLPLPSKDEEMPVSLGGPTF